MPEIEMPIPKRIDQSENPESLVTSINRFYPSILLIALLIIGIYLIMYTSLEDRTDSIGTYPTVIPGNSQLKFNFYLEHIRLNSEEAIRINGLLGIPPSFTGAPFTYPLGNGIIEWNRPYYIFDLKVRPFTSDSKPMRLEGIVYGPSNSSWRSPLSNDPTFSYYVTVPEVSSLSDPVNINLLPAGNYSVVITNLEPKEVNVTLAIESKVAHYSRPYFWYGLFILIIASGYPILVLITRWKYRGD